MEGRGHGGWYIPNTPPPPRWTKIPLILSPPKSPNLPKNPPFCTRRPLVLYHENPRIFTKKHPRDMKIYQKTPHLLQKTSQCDQKTLHPKFLPTPPQFLPKKKKLPNLS